MGGAVLNRLCTYDCDYKNLSPLTLAFIGDAVYDLFVREQLVCKANCSVGKLNKMKVEKVCCKAQANFMDSLKDKLSEEEISIYKRGRNAHTNNVPKNASVADYHNATGFETLIGYLYLKEDISRIREIFELIYNIKE